METTNLLHFGTRPELRQWLKENHSKEKCCWVVTYRGKCPPEWLAIPYIDVVKGVFNRIATAMTGSLSPK